LGHRTRSISGPLSLEKTERKEKAVELKLKDGSVRRVGTDDASGLAARAAAPVNARPTASSDRNKQQRFRVVSAQAWAYMRTWR
jgi:hypothetical protein